MTDYEKALKFFADLGIKATVSDKEHKFPTKTHVVHKGGRYEVEILEEITIHYRIDTETVHGHGDIGLLFDKDGKFLTSVGYEK